MSSDAACSAKHSISRWWIALAPIGRMQFARGARARINGSNPIASECASSQRFKSSRAWASKANFASGNTYCGLQSDLDAELESGERKAARASWATALRTARSLGSQYPRGELMRMIVESQLKAGLLAEAIEAIQAATQDTEEAEDDGDSRWVLKVVAGRASAGDFATL